MEESQREYTEQSSKREFDFDLLLKIFRKNILWIMLCIFVCILGSVIYLRYTQPVYKASATIQLSSNQNNQQISEVVGANSGFFYDVNQIDVDIELLNSNHFLEKSLHNLPLEIRYFSEGELLENELYKSSPFSVELIEVKDSSVLNKKIFIRFTKAEFEIRYLEGENQIIKKGKINYDISTPHFIINIDIGDFDYLKKLQQNNEYYFLIQDIERLARSYHKNLLVKIANRFARTVQISFTDKNPQLANDIVSSHIKEYFRYDGVKKEESFQNILNFIKKQIDTVSKSLRKYEMELQRLKKQNKIQDVEGFSSVYLERLNQFDENRLKLELDAKLMDEIESQILTNPNENEVYNLIPQLVGTDYNEVLLPSIEELQELIARREQALNDVTSTSKKIKTLETAIKKQKQNVLSDIGGIKKNIERSLDGIQGKTREIDAMFMSLPQKELEFSRLQRLFIINEKYYTLLLEKQTEYSISKAGQISNNQILNKSVVPISPISPKRKLTIISAFLLGLIISILLIIYRYLTHQEISSIIDLEKITEKQIVILGVIPTYKNEMPVSQLIINKKPKSLIAEAFRNLRTNIEFISNKSSCRTIGFTSTVSGEGKTFLAINLAAIIASSGKKVIVLDLDMRKPKVHLGLGVENTRGMSTLLIGKDKIENTINNSSFENLDFITAGSTPPNPSELIINGVLDEIITELKTKYDVIIFDNPPVGLVTDGIPIIKQVDIPIYVMRANYSKRIYVKNIFRLIQENKISNLSVVLNGVENKSPGGYGYAYGYGYGYGEYYEEEEKCQKRKRTFKKKK